MLLPDFPVTKLNWIFHDKCETKLISDARYPLHLAPGRSKVPHTLCLSCTWCAAPSKLAPTVQPLRSYLFVPLAFEICVAKTVRCRQNPDLSYQIVKQYLPLEELKFKYLQHTSAKPREEWANKVILGWWRNLLKQMQCNIKKMEVEEIKIKPYWSTLLRTSRSELKGISEGKRKRFSF